MSKQPREPSSVIPLLVAALVCDVAVADPVTGKKNLIGIFDRIMVGTFPTKRPMSVYIKLADADGYYEVAVRYVERGTNTTLVEALKHLEQSKSMIDSRPLIYIFRFRPFPFRGKADMNFKFGRTKCS